MHSMLRVTQMMCKRQILWLLTAVVAWGCIASNFASEPPPAPVPNVVHFRAVILVLSSHHNALVRNCRRVWKAYMHLNPRVKVFFVYGSSGASLQQEAHDLIYPDIEENYNPGMLLKTVAAMETIHASNFTYDFLVRTNIGTFWDLDALLEHLDELPTSLCYSGHGPHGDGTYLSGVDTIVNRDMVTAMITAKASLRYHDVAEDQAMGFFFHGTLGAPFLPSRIFFLGGASGEGIPLQSTLAGPIRDEISLGMQRLPGKGHYQQTAPSYSARADHYRVKSARDRDTLDMACYVQLCAMVYNVSCNLDFEGVGFIYPSSKNEVTK